MIHLGMRASSLKTSSVNSLNLLMLFISFKNKVANYMVFLLLHFSCKYKYYLNYIQKLRHHIHGKINLIFHVFHCDQILYSVQIWEEPCTHTKHVWCLECILCAICIGIFSINTIEYENLSFFYYKLKRFLLMMYIQ